MVRPIVIPFVNCEVNMCGVYPLPPYSSSGVLIIKQPASLLAFEISYI